MKYLEHKPSVLLRNYVDHISFSSFDLEEDNLNSCIVPDCMTELVFNFGREYKRKTVRSDDYTSIVGSHLVGIKSQPHLLLENKEIDKITIRFKPSRLAFFTKISMKEITDSAVDPFDVFGREILEIEEKIQETKDYSAKIEIVEKFLFKKYQANSGKDQAYKILASMYHNPGDTTLTNTLLKNRLYYKKLERLFFENLGISPKLASRIIRVNYAIVKKISENSLSFAELAFLSNYFDQSHFVKDFLSLANRKPKDFFNYFSEMESINFMSVMRQFPPL